MFGHQTGLICSDTNWVNIGIVCDWSRPITFNFLLNMVLIDSWYFGRKLPPTRMYQIKIENVYFNSFFSRSRYSFKPWTCVKNPYVQCTDSARIKIKKGAKKYCRVFYIPMYIMLVVLSNFVLVLLVLCQIR